MSRRVSKRTAPRERTATPAEIIEAARQRWLRAKAGTIRDDIDITQEIPVVTMAELVGQARE
jgi:hypothetical protein